ncbi:hypothetical protein [Cypionkella sp. TWP1-2-1b2]|uniref:hypothetical protein n=1 Tax=Cypionkella sp. TWP1-2-1b2 TaxID=2804675 RepID=UPI003CEB5663
MRDILADIEKPKFNLSKVEARTGISIQEDIATQIQQIYGSYATEVFSSAISKILPSTDNISAQQSDELGQSEFKSLIEKLQRKAAELEEIVDSLAEFDCGLLFRPEDNRDRSIYKSNLASLIDLKFGCSAASYRLTQQEFSDYYSFRKLLDYYRRFENINRPFNSHYAARYSLETGHTDYERFIRHIVVLLMQSGYPATITIPTDTNPDYESPLIAALLELQQQHNSAFATVTKYDLDYTQRFSYRQFAHLLGRIIADIRKIEEVFSEIIRRHA